MVVVGHVKKISKQTPLLARFMRVKHVTVDTRNYYDARDHYNSLFQHSSLFIVSAFVLTSVCNRPDFIDRRTRLPPPR